MKTELIKEFEQEYQRSRFLQDTGIGDMHSEQGCYCDEYVEYLEQKLANEVNKSDSNYNISHVSGMLPLTENAKSKLEYINGSCIVRDFPKEQPTKQWAGAVLDLLEELGLGNYR